MDNQGEVLVLTLDFPVCSIQTSLSAPSQVEFFSLNTFYAGSCSLQLVLSACVASLKKSPHMSS